jgi:hypothetical protein
MPGEDENVVVDEDKESEAPDNFGSDPVTEPTEDLTFEIDEEKGEVTESEPEADPDDVSDELADTSERVHKRIGKLTYERREAERVRDEAVGYAKNVVAENESLKKKLSGQETVTITEAEERNKSQMAEAKSSLRKAREDEDIDIEVEATELMGRLSAEANMIQRAKRNAVRKAEEGEDDTSDTSPPAAPAAPSEENLDPKAVAWANNTPWFGEHQGMTDYAMSQHFAMLREGFDPKSNEYYTEVENRVQNMFPHMFKKRASASPAEDGATETPVRKRSGQTVAPAGNSSGSASKKSKTVVTTSEQAMAQSLGIPNEAYAREKARLARERELENA